MIRKFTLLVLLVSTFVLQSQTLTQSFNEPVIGDVNNYYPTDTALFTTGLPTTITGSTSVWNFTNLRAQLPLITENYVSPSTSTTSASYTGCTVLQNAGTLFTYLKSTTSPTTQTEVLGLSSTTMSLKFTNSAILTKYPVSYGSTHTDNISGTFVYSVSGTCSGNITTNADGLGTLNLPNSQSLTNVLRVKSVQTITLSYIIPIGTLKQTVYNYYHSSQKFPIVSINYTSITLTGQTSTVTGVVTGHSAYFTAQPVGINSQAINESNFSIYPNPALNQFYLQLDNPNAKPVNVEISDLTGQKVKSIAIGTGNINEAIATNGMTKGLYFVKVTQGTAVSTRKLLIE